MKRAGTSEVYPNRGYEPDGDDDYEVPDDDFRSESEDSESEAEITTRPIPDSPRLEQGVPTKTSSTKYEC